MTVIAELNEDCGVTYLALTADRFVAEAVRSAESVKRHMPALEIACISDREASHPVFDRWIPYRPTVDAAPYGPRGGFLNKIDALSQSPFDRTLFLDTDTYCCHPVWELFSLLHKHDLVACHSPTGANIEWGSDEATRKFLAGEPFTPNINTGVIAYRRNERMQRFFAHWIDTFIRRYAADDPEYSDQTVFRETISQTDLATCWLTAEYNHRVSAPAAVDGHVRILHGRPQDGFGGFERHFNSHTGKRVLMDELGVMYVGLEDGEGYVAYRAFAQPSVEHRLTFPEFIKALEG